MGNMRESGRIRENPTKFQEDQRESGRIRKKPREFTRIQKKPKE